jgi:hypothetical protein
MLSYKEWKVLNEQVLGAAGRTLGMIQPSAIAAIGGNAELAKASPEEVKQITDGIKSSTCEELFTPVPEVLEVGVREEPGQEIDEAKKMKKMKKMHDDSDDVDDSDDSDDSDDANDSDDNGKDCPPGCVRDDSDDDDSDDDDSDDDDSDDDDSDDDDSDDDENKVNLKLAGMKKEDHDFFASLKSQSKGTVDKKYNDGHSEYQEDVLFPHNNANEDLTDNDNEPGPGDVGFAPQGKVGGDTV